MHFIPNAKHLFSITNSYYSVLFPAIFLYLKKKKCLFKKLQQKKRSYKKAYIFSYFSDKLLL